MQKKSYLAFPQHANIASYMKRTLNTLTQRQIDILYAMKDGAISIDDIAKALKISRPAAQKHLEALLRSGLSEEDVSESTGGRPRRIYRLTSRGRELFPRQYAWFLGLLIDHMKAETGSASVTARLKKLAQNLATEKGSAILAKPPRERLKAIAAFMNTLGYEARTETEDEISATNCIYHDLAIDHPEVCQFDIALLENLSGAKIEHTECIVRGGKLCRFKTCESKKKT